MLKTFSTLLRRRPKSSRAFSRNPSGKTTRYFKDELATWKFEEGQTPKVKTALSSAWIESSFRSLDEFLVDPAGLTETSAEEAEDSRVEMAN